ncbi:MAG: alpha/beta hydrolase [Acidobacteria bacterium]|nr:alpha/beta hydrolase [Acidobacteriota bacterium]
MAHETVREIPGPVGALESRLDLPDRPPRAVAVIGHPHPLLGGTMHTKAVYQTAKALARIGVAALRFNFRGVGLSAGTFDEGGGERDDFRAAIDFAAARFPGLPIWAAGMSFGSWIALSVGADDPRVTLLIAIAPPVDRYAYDAVKASTKPKFIIHGEEDEVVSVREVRKLYGEIPEPRELVVIDGADHVFDGKTSLVGEAIEDLLGDFEKDVTGNTKSTKDTKAGKVD